MSGVISDNTVRSSGAIAPLTSATTDANDPARDTNPTDGLGTKWINTTSGQIFICTDATTDENVWIGQAGTAIVGPRILFAGGYSDKDDEHEFDSPGKVNIISYTNPTSLGDTVDFGDMVAANQYGCGTSNGTNERGVFGGGCTAADCPTTTIQYVTCSTTGNATDYADLTAARTYAGACSNGTNDRGVWAGGGATGSDVKSNIIDYITISSGGTATDSGNLVQARDYTGGLSNGTNDRGINASGRGAANAHQNEIDYWTISSGGNAADFGNLTNTRTAPGTCSNDTNERGLFMCGAYGGSYSDAIDYITINTTGNASDFGDMDGSDMGYGAGSARGHTAGTSNGTGERGVNGGGYTSTSGTSNWYKDIRYVTISTTGNGTFFGNLTERTYGPFACNNTFG